MIGEVTSYQFENKRTQSKIKKKKVWGSKKSLLESCIMIGATIFPPST
jgi:hypothetical protein